MEYAQYLRFLPAEYRTQATEAIAEPTSTWWPWKGHRVHIARAAAPEASVRSAIRLVVASVPSLAKT